jgi:hypothetical protein
MAGQKRKNSEIYTELTEFDKVAGISKYERVLTNGRD